MLKIRLLASWLLFRSFPKPKLRFAATIILELKLRAKSSEVLRFAITLSQLSHITLR